MAKRYNHIRRTNEQAVEALSDHNHSHVARNLVELLENTILNDESLGGEPVASAIGKLRKLVWPSKNLKENIFTADERKVKFDEITSELDDTQKHQLYEAYARMGHLHEMASLIARENYFNAIREKQKLQREADVSPEAIILPKDGWANKGENKGKKSNILRQIDVALPDKLPGGIAEFVHAQSSVDEVIGKLNAPIFETVMTAHPTNTNSLESMKAQRQLAIEIEKGDINKIVGAMQKFAREPLTAREGIGKDATNVNFTVRDETRMMLDCLHNIYTDLPRIYKGFDEELNKKAEIDGLQYDKTKLHLRLQFGSWGSAGDKDGNNKIYSENTLEALVLHTLAIVECYHKDIKNLPTSLQLGLGEWQDKLERAQTKLEVLKQDVHDFCDKASKQRQPGASAVMSGEAVEKGFSDISKRLAAIRKELDPEKLDPEKNFAHEFSQSVISVYNDNSLASSNDDKKNLLNLVRRIRTFGLNFAKVEYRETAEEYQRVAELLLKDKGYVAANVQNTSDAYKKNLEILNKVLQGDKPEALLTSEIKTKLIEGATKAYNKKDVEPIAYHTLKRMELARDFPDMIQDNVLAECGKLPSEEPPSPNDPKYVRWEEEHKRILDANTPYQGAANMLEALLMQKVIGANERGERAAMGIVPLFEEPNTMERVDKILEMVYKSPAYGWHMDDLQEKRGFDARTQEVQIAHSDNARRSGLVAARAYIHEAHEKIRALNAEYHINTRFFEGGSMSDAYRNGVRAISATVNDFGLHDFSKFTFQGGDLLNFFNMPGSCERLFARNISHAADHFVKDGNRYRVMTQEEWADRTRNKRNGTASVPDEVADKIAISALKKTLKAYEHEDFTKARLGVLLDALDYHAEARIGNAGSRAGSRNGGDDFKEGFINPVDVIDGTRTIPFSEIPQHAGLSPAWIGAQNLGALLIESIKETSVKNMSPELRGMMGNIMPANHEFPIFEALQPQQIKYFYDKSRAFHDAIDRIANAVANTDPNVFGRIDKALDSKSDSLDPKTGESYKQSGLAYNARLKRDYITTAKMALAALLDEKEYGKVEQKLSNMGGDKLDMSDKKCLDMQQMLREEMLQKGLRESKNEIMRKTGFRGFLIHEKEKGGLSELARRILHNAGDTVMHGRSTRTSDISYGRSYQGYIMNKKPRCLTPNVRL